MVTKLGQAELAKQLQPLLRQSLTNAVSDCLSNPCYPCCSFCPAGLFTPVLVEFGPYLGQVVLAIGWSASADAAKSIIRADVDSRARRGTRSDGMLADPWWDLLMFSFLPSE